MNDNRPPHPASALPEAAVAIIRADQPEESYLLLRRNDHPSDPWSGHFSFPGGRREERDADLLATCLRETEEETGIILGSASLEEALPLARAGRNVQAPILVQPFLFRLTSRPAIRLNAREFQNYAWVASSRLRQNDLHTEVEVFPERVFPAFPLQDYYIWGFTYGLLQSIIRW